MAETSNDLLQQTSRSFYLTLRVLPGVIRPQIGLAYLLARTTDTIADTELVPPAQRLEALQKLRERILGSSPAPLDFGELARQQGSPAERLLLEKVEDSLAQLKLLSPADLQLVRAVLDTITSGQELDLRRFGRWGETTGEPSSTRAARGDARPTNQIIALRTDEELDDYTYRVAGCVGEFWTKLCRAHIFPNAKLNDAQLLADGVRFGKGLQLVNILRDLPADLSKGRCYLPAERLAAAGLAPGDLLQPDKAPKLRPLYDRYLDLAGSHLATGWAYTNALPWRCVRVRLGCAWPILIGVKTIERLRAANMLDPRQRIKISRCEVRWLMARSVICYPWPTAWRKLAPAPAAASGKAVASGVNLTY
jgi:farnesyl-diphosphate farnesyltransferase